MKTSSERLSPSFLFIFFASPLQDQGNTSGNYILDTNIVWYTGLEILLGVLWAKCILAALRIILSWRVTALTDFNSAWRSLSVPQTTCPSYQDIIFISLLHPPD